MKPDDPIEFPCGLKMKNRFMLAPMTNTQSHEDGTLSDDEFNWLTMRAEGQFGMVMTCASHVQPNGKGFPGQLGIFDDQHIEGHKRLTSAIKSHGSLAVIQLYHGGMRADSNLIEGDPVCPSAVLRKGARGLSIEEVHDLRDDFIKAAQRAQVSGYDGIQIHGAHGYIIAQFLSQKINHRTDDYGGSLKSRTRLLFEIIEGIRSECGPDFLIGVRLSPERFGMLLSEIKTICLEIDEQGIVDSLDISLWDSFKMPVEEEHSDKSLLRHFTDLNLQHVVLSVAGKIRSAQDVHHLINAKVDAVSIGMSAILHHDFPSRVINNPKFESVSWPIDRAYLNKEGVSDTFVKYLKSMREGLVLAS